MPKLASPAATSQGLPLHAHLQGNLAQSPSDTLVLVGGLHLASPSADPRTAPGRLLVLDARTLAPMTHVDLDPHFGGVGRVHWCSRTNQVVAATASGACVVLYSDEHSDKGVKLCVGRAGASKRKTQWVDEELEQVLLERAGAELEIAAQRMAKGKGKKGNALVQVHGGKISKRQLAAIRGDVVPAKRVAERGKLAAQSEGGGAIFFAQSDTHSKPPMDRDVDPREAILKYAEVAAKDPYWITPAYKATQPEQVLADKVVEEDEAERVIAKEDKQKVLRRRDF
ncbi:hypothetical protein BCR44DRAFT_1459930 [Catenaria anguillulae PL171]|uniref:Uncharacterized protein n=1 Tax=Catenaria anguillulae PL171 TaxID=765915 RepID=A0A1Y2HS36_9FUNG|nr:hypothetical protein BCR44DRAFT_1459930 [Catenaria anguillulae PL171]